MTMIRPSRDEDIAAITAIYAHHVLNGTGTFEIDPPSVADMTSRRADVLVGGFPIEFAGQINHRNIGRWNAKGHAGELLVEFGNDYANGLGSPG